MINKIKLSEDTILDATEKVIRRYGPEKTSVVDVARALNVSHGMIYRYFSSKSSLQEAVTKRWLNRISEPLNKIAQENTGSSRTRLRLWMDTLIDIKSTNAMEDPELFMMYTTVTLQAIELISTHINDLINQISHIIEIGMQNGEFKAGDPKIVAKGIFMATLQFHHPAHSYEWLSDTIDEDFEVVWNIVLSGITN